MKYPLITFTLLISTVFAKDPPRITVENVMKDAVYASVQINDLEAIPEQNLFLKRARPEPLKKIDKILANIALKKLAETLNKLTDAPHPEVEIEQYRGLQRGITLFGRNKQCRVFMVVNGDGQITYFSLSQNTAPHNGEKVE